MKFPHLPRIVWARFFRSIFFKATLIVALAVATVTAVMASLSYLDARANAVREAQEHAEVVSPMIARQVAGPLRFAKSEQARAVLDQIILDGNGTATGAVVIDIEGKPLAARIAGANIDLLQETALEALYSGGPFRAEDGFTYAVPVTAGEEGIIYGALATSWTADPALALLHAGLLRAAAITAAIFLATLLVAAHAFYRVIARPITRINAAMTRVAAADYQTRVPCLRRRDEIGAIAASLEAFRAALAASKETNRAALMRGAALEAGSTAVMLTDSNRIVTYANDAMKALLRCHGAAIRKSYPGCNPEDLVGSSAEQLIGTDPEAGAPPQSAQKTRHEHRFESGTVVITVSRVSDADGADLGYVAEWRDITEDKRAAAVVSAIDLSQARAEFATDGRLAAANARFLELFGAEAANVLGRTLGDSLAMRDGAAGAALFSELALGHPLSGAFELERGGSAPAILLGAISPVLDAQCQPQAYVLLGTDVTASEAALAANETARSRAEAAQQAVVEALRGALSRLSEGDLTAEITTIFTPAYGQLRSDFNSALKNMRLAMRGVVESAAAIGSDAAEISTAADDLSRRTEQQAGALEETAAALDQLTASVKSAAEMAAHANQMVASAKSNAETSGQVVREAILAMGEIAESSGKISKITSVIDEIAFQTNLLALNAGVEAARAGEAGRGFAVVASEVRALAQRSSEAAREIASLIAASSGQVKRGVGLVGQAGEALGGIESSVREIYGAVSEIAASAREQSTGLAEINTAVNQLDQVTQQNAAMFEQTTAASHSLTRGAETLAETTAKFRIGSETAAPAAVTSSLRRSGPGTEAHSAPAAATTAGGAAPPPRSHQPLPAAPARSALSASRGFGAGRQGAQTATAAQLPDEADWEDF
ncbi:MAG: methyl-accepting chemotaxis protein [Phaeovulum sp.]|uniref:methyl-accepting chemotaxis protein n=1 Tax=Phaeovulum sp. TaxID=2934796 RepID=UPI0027307F72|nr:methyl-accepting chemotaxis protein [Phaeovulum sp.]MDP2062748.1 methyl-accepting chemotaxis protein [Phaeovulum sp.]